MYKRIVVKIGTKVLTKENGQINETIIKSFVRQIYNINKNGVQIIVVTSGAVGFGRNLLKSKSDAETVSEKQVLAAIGQIKLMEVYSKFFNLYGYLCAQVLVTKEDFRDKNHYQNMRDCFLNLLHDGIIPIVNENDVVAIKELLFTDNDELSGLIATQLQADAVIILTSVDGILDGNPSDSSSKTIPEINSKNIASFQKYITQEKTNVGRGGMVTKFNVARKLMSSGIAVHIVDGKKENVLQDVIDGHTIGTKFIPSRKTSGIKRRLAYSEGLTAGFIMINKCISDILISKKSATSLLPIGIIVVKGDFKKGDVVEIRNQDNIKMGFGISAYNSNKIKEVIGKKNNKPVIHYDYMFIE